MGITLRVLFVFLLINQLLLHSTAFSRRNGGGIKSNKENAPKTFVGTSSGLPSQNTVRRGLGLSAWGIIGVTITIILAGTGFYYFSMCYPILCKKQRKYDMIGLPNVA
ncbi:hypothetical protein evm_004702 [Chilo suppressalis]|nr:hypothetical protein evm_004702 [Chilo suppressalis]